jgi:DNA-binding transcriptional LysR family regulator
MKFIESFLTLYEEGNISRASEKLFISQQGLSRQIKALESEMDVILFSRSRLGVEPTAICKKLYPVFLRMRGEHERALALLDEDRKRHGQRITVAFAQGISNSGSAEFIFDYQRQHPEVEIEILESPQPVCVQKLLSNEIDMAFLVTPIDMAMVNATTLSEGFMYAAMHKTHPLAGRAGPLDFSLLDGESIITGSPQNALRGVFDYFCELAAITPHIIVSSNYSLNYVNAMAEDSGIATVTAAMALKITNPDIRVHRLLAPEPAYVFCCTPRDGKGERGIISLLNYVKRHFELEPLPQLGGSS